MASKKFYADLELQTNVRISGDGVDTTQGGTTGSDKIITSGAVHSALGTKAELAGSASQDFSTDNLTVNGDLTLIGKINQETVNDLSVQDRTITLNDGGTLGTNTSGFIVDGSGISTDAELYYDGSDNTWKIKESDVSAVAISTFDGAYGSLTGAPTTIAPSAHTHAASEIDSGTFANARIAEANVTQHEGALSIGYSQLTSVPTTFAPSAHNHAASEINSGTFGDARIAQSNVTQHEAALGIDWSQLASVPTSFAPSAHTHAAADITSGAFADARISQASVVQYQAALLIEASQITSGSMADARIQESNVTQHEDALEIDWSQLVSVPNFHKTYTKAIAAATSATATLANATEVTNALVQIIDNNGAIIDCQVVKSGADIEVSVDVAVTGTIVITTFTAAATAL